MMKRENLVLDTVCFRIFIARLHKWNLLGRIEPRPVFERAMPVQSLAEAPARFDSLRQILEAAEVEVEDLRTKFNNNLVPVDAEESFFANAELIEISDMYGFDHPLEVLLDLDCPQLVPEDKLEQVVRRFDVARVFAKQPSFEQVFTNSSGWYCTVKKVEYYTDQHLPEEERFIPQGFAIVGH